jgi:MoxR-like ATPase
VPDSIVATTPTIDDAPADVAAVRAACAAFRETYARVKGEIARVMVGQDGIVDLVLTALFADGHVLLEGVPGLGKTLLIRTLGQALDLPFNRIQFTPDLMPADITGTSIVIEDEATGHRTFEFRPGPIFSQLLLADEINRATPKSQAALLEAMQERAVTVAGTTHALVRPFFVMATQNPIEQEGTYPLPEAQLDRFLFKVVVPYTTRKELNEILRRTTTTATTQAGKVLDGPRILQAQRLARRVVAAPHVQDYAIRLVLATHPGGEFIPQDLERHINVGVSPRGAQAMLTGAKVRALIDGRYHVAFKDLHDVAHAALRHRIIRSFEAEAEGITTNDIVDRIIQSLPYDADETFDGSRSSSL